jgi:hypothetical protein
VKGFEPSSSGGYSGSTLSFKGKGLLVVPDATVVRFTILDNQEGKHTTLDIHETAVVEGETTVVPSVEVVPCDLQHDRIVAKVPDFGETKADVQVELFIDGIGILDQTATYTARSWPYLGHEAAPAVDDTDVEGADEPAGD